MFHDNSHLKEFTYKRDKGKCKWHNQQNSQPIQTSNPGNKFGECDQGNKKVRSSTNKSNSLDQVIWFIHNLVDMQITTCVGVAIFLVCATLSAAQDSPTICRDDTHIYTSKKGFCKCYYFTEKVNWVRRW